MRCTSFYNLCCTSLPGLTQKDLPDVFFNYINELFVRKFKKKKTKHCISFNLALKKEYFKI